MKPLRIRERARRLLNRLSRPEDIRASKRKWDKLAAENGRYYVLSSHGKEIDEATFREEGERDYRALVAEDTLLKEKLGGSSDKRALEIGCGLGRLTEFFARDFGSITGVDISEEMIRGAKERLAHLKNVTLFATDGLTLPVADASIDLVFSYIVFQHMPDAATVEQNLKEVCRVLKHGGIAKIQVRGAEAEKGTWFYGVSFRHADIARIFESLPATLVREEGEGERYYWVTFVKR